MANIKFSDFTVGNTEGDIDFVVGYKGANNIQISPTNLLASALGNYLPLAGGTMTGDLKLNDNVVAKFGTGDDLRIQHSSSGGGAGYIQNYTGDLQIQNRATDKDVLFRADDGSGVVTTYFYLDGGRSDGSNVATRFPDGSIILLGSGTGWNDGSQIYHNGTNSFWNEYVGNIEISCNTTDGDIIFKSDDGSGGLSTYFFLDGSKAGQGGGRLFTKFPDNSTLAFGTDLGDLQIYHNGFDSLINNNTGDLYITNQADGKDIIFRSDNGSGVVTTYFFLDGSAGGTNPVTIFPDSSYLKFGTSQDLSIVHSGSGSEISHNGTGDLVIQNTTDDKDILFKSDDGSGGTTEYFRLDGLNVRTNFSVDAQFSDNKKARFGNSADFQLYHTGTESNIYNLTGNLNISNDATDGDIIFKSDDGSGGIDTYFYLDGGGVLTRFDKRLRMSDAVGLQLGSSGNFEMYHLTGNTTMDNFTGNLTIRNSANDKDISFACDDGSGGATEYFRVDGGSVLTFFSKPIQIADNQNIFVGDSGDLQIYHDGSHSYIEDAGTGDLRIKTNSAIAFLGNANEDMIVAVNNGAVSLYYDNSKKFETTSAGIDVSGQVSVNDYLVHNGDTNTYLGYNGADSFELVVGGTQKITADTNAVYLRYQGAAKLETRSTGIKITGVSEYADNTAAIAGGLTTGDVYRTGDLLKIVH
jgi:hypothetical protein